MRDKQPRVLMYYVLCVLMYEYLSCIMYERYKQIVAVKRSSAPTPGAALTFILYGFGRAESVPAGKGARGLVVLAGQGGGELGPRRVGARVRAWVWSAPRGEHGLVGEGGVEVGRVGRVREEGREERRVAACQHARPVAPAEEAVAPDLGGVAHRAQPLGHLAPKQRLEQRSRRTSHAPG